MIPITVTRSLKQKKLLSKMATYIYKNNEQLGPFEDAVVLSALLDGAFDYSDLCWREGWEDWRTLDSIYSKPNNKENTNPAAEEKPSVKESSSTGGLFSVILKRIKSVIGDREFSNYDECPKIFYRFDGGEEYGPSHIHRFIDNLPGYSKNSLKECRFADEKKWRPKEYFLDLYNRIPVGESAVTKLRKLKISFHANILHKEALKLISEADSKLAPTKSMLKKLKDHGVDVESLTTKKDALNLIKEIEKKDSIIKEAERTLLRRLDDQPLFEEKLHQLEELKNKIVQILPGWKPKEFETTTSDLSELEAYIELLQDALENALIWDADSFIKYPFLEMKYSKDGSLDEVEYKLSFPNNTVPKDGLIAFQGMVFKSYIKAESDEFSRLPLLKKAFPTAVIKKVG